MAWTLSPELQTKILELHNAGYSYRLIAHKVRVTRATVSKVVRRGRIMPPPADRVPGQVRRVWGRCPSCRCYVLLPCLACSLLKMQEQQRCDGHERRAICDPNGLHDDLALKLEGDELARYQEIRNSHFGQKKDCNRTPPVL